MAITQATPAAAVTRDPAVRDIKAADLRAALSEGWDDFIAKRGDLVFIGLLYPLIGFVTAFAALGNRLIPLLFPLAAGISLLGPLVTTGFYELAKRRELGLDSRWRHFFDIRKSPSLEGILAVGALMVGIFIVWLAAAQLIYNAFFGVEPPASLFGFINELFTTRHGLAMMIVGNLVGLFFAALILAVSVVSLPMLVDRDTDAGTAIGTSLRAVKANPWSMARWGLIVATLLILASIPFFLGLAIVLPWLGYATWHLYTRVVEREGTTTP